MRFKIVAILLAAVGLIANIHPAFSASINGDAFYAGSIPSSPGTGLSATYYGNVYAGGDISSDDALVGSTTPAARFLSTAIDYPAGVSGSTFADTNSLSSFLGVDAPSLTPSSVGSNTLGDQLITFSGYIALQAGTTYLQMGVDDGGYVNIGGIGYNSSSQIIDNSGNHAFAYAGGSVTVSQSGLYPIYVDYHESGGNTGLTFQYDGTSGIGPLVGGTVVPTAVLYSTVPEPSSIALLGLGLGAAALLIAARRRRREA